MASVFLCFQLNVCQANSHDTAEEEGDVFSALAKAKTSEGIILLTPGALHEQHGSYIFGVPEQSWVGADRSLSLGLSHNSLTKEQM